MTQPPLFVVDNPLVAEAVADYLRPRGFAARPLQPKAITTIHVSPNTFLLIETQLPGPSDGLLWVRDILNRYPSLTPIPWTTHPDGLHLWTARRWGLPAFLDKGMSGHDILHWLEQIVLARGGWPGFLLQQASRWGNSVAVRLQNLPARAWPLWDDLIQGQQDAHIARRRGWSRRTVSRRLGQLYAELEVSGRCDAVRQAVNWGLVTVDETPPHLKRIARAVFDQS